MQERIITYVIALLLAAASYFTGAVTDVGGALSIAVDKEQQKAICVDLIEKGEITKDEDETITIPNVVDGGTL